MIDSTEEKRVGCCKDGNCMVASHNCPRKRANEARRFCDIKKEGNCIWLPQTK